MKDADREVPRAVKGVIFRIGVFYIGSIFFMAALLPTDEYEAGTSPFVTVFGRMGFGWIADVIQVILIVAALSSLNSGLFATGRILRSLGMSKQAPAFTVKMSTSGVPWAGILMTCIVYGFGVYLNAISPNAFETALEMGALTVIYVWITIFACQLRLRWLANRGVVPMSKFRMPGYPYTGILSIAFLLLVAVGLAYSGWLSSPSFWHKSDFIVVVIGLPAAAAVLGAAWLLVRAKVAAQTGGSLGPVWSVPPTNPKQERES
jgi:L-asparagine permease